MSLAKSVFFTFLALLVAASFVPLASAQATQTFITKVSPPTSPIQPEIANPALTVEVKYQVESAPFTGVGAVSPNLKVDIAFTCPAYVVITGPASITMTVTPGQETAFTETGSFNVAVKRTAPGLEQIPCTVKATANALGQLESSSSADTRFSVSADYYSLLQATVSKQLQQSGPYKNVPFQMDITNFGNARTQINFELVTEPKGGKWNVILPTQMILESPNTGLTPTQGQATMTVSTTYKNGWNNEQGSYTININSVAADDVSKPGNELQTNFLVRVRGVYVPSLEPVLMLGALIGSAMILRLRKES